MTRRSSFGKAVIASRCRWRTRSSFAAACHRLAPFCFFNGNTFVSIIALVIKRLELPADQAAVVRSLAGHIVAGVATEIEERALQEFCATLG